MITAALIFSYVTWGGTVKIFVIWFLSNHSSHNLILKDVLKKKGLKIYMSIVFGITVGESISTAYGFPPVLWVVYRNMLLSSSPIKFPLPLLSSCFPQATVTSTPNDSQVAPSPSEGLYNPIRPHTRNLPTALPVNTLYWEEEQRGGADCLDQ